MKNSELKFIDIDLLLEKCACCSQKKNYQIINFADEDIFFCSRSNLINNKEFTETECLYCFSDFQIKNIEFKKYNIYKVN